MGVGASTEQTPARDWEGEYKKADALHCQAVLRWEASRRNEMQLQSRLSAQNSEVYRLNNELRKLKAAPNSEVCRLNNELRKLKEAQTATAADTVSGKEYDELMDDYDELEKQLANVKKAMSGSQIKWNRDKESYLAQIKNLETQLKTLRNVDIPRLKQFQEQEKTRSVMEKELMAVEMEKFKALASEERRHRQKLQAENKKLADQLIFQKWNDVLDAGQKIKVAYAACTKKPTTAVEAPKSVEPKKADDPLLKPDQAKPPKPQEQVTDAELLIMTPSWDAGYETRNGRPHIERLRTEKGIIGFIFFESVEKAQQ
ncbi:unnamed protein product, partial [Mesorhabditis spiculigera]